MRSMLNAVPQLMRSLALHPLELLVRIFARSLSGRGRRRPRRAPAPRPDGPPPLRAPPAERLSLKGGWKMCETPMDLGGLIVPGLVLWRGRKRHLLPYLFLMGSEEALRFGPLWWRNLN